MPKHLWKDSFCKRYSIKIKKHNMICVHVIVRKAAKIRYRYNQVPHLTKGYHMGSDKTQLSITNKSQEVNPFPAGDHKAAINRRESMKITRHK